MPYDNPGFMLPTDPDAPPPERRTTPKYPPPQAGQPAVDPQAQAFAAWRAQQPDAAPTLGFPVNGMQDVTPQGPPPQAGPLPLILNGPDAAAAGPSVLSQRLGVSPGQFSAREVGQNLSPQNAVNGTFTADDLSRYKRYGGGQIQDAAPQNVAERVANAAQQIGIGQKNQEIGIEQQKNDLNAKRLEYDLGRNKIRDQYELSLMNNPNIDSAKRKDLLDEWDQQNLQSQALAGARSGKTAPGGGTQPPAAIPELPLDMRQKVDKAQSPTADKAMEKIYTSYGPESASGGKQLTDPRALKMLKEKMANTYGADATKDSAEAGWFSKAVELAAVASNPAEAGKRIGKFITGGGIGLSDVPIMERARKAIGIKSSTEDKRNAFIRNKMYKGE